MTTTPTTPKPRADPRMIGGLLLSAALACSRPGDTQQETEACPPGESCATGTTDSSASASSTSNGTTSASTSTASATTSSSPTSSSSTSASAGTTTGCNFICDPDGGATDTCDVLAQDCPEGQKCAPYDSDGDNAWDAATCVDVTGDGLHGEPCTSEGTSGQDSCDVGVMCWNLDEQGEGTCVALCSGSIDDPHCEPQGTYCSISAMAVLILCLDLCDPTLLECQPGDVCVSNFQDGFACTLDASGGVAPPGSPCAFVNDCNPGSFCADPLFAPHPDCEGADGCCSAFCDLNDGNAPCQQQDPAFECVPWFEQGQAPPEYAHVGGCGLPG